MCILSFQVQGNGCNEGDSGKRREKPKGDANIQMEVRISATNAVD